MDALWEAGLLTVEEDQRCSRVADRYDDLNTAIRSIRGQDGRLSPYSLRRPDCAQNSGARAVRHACHPSKLPRGRKRPGTPLKSPRSPAQRELEGG